MLAKDDNINNGIRPLRIERFGRELVGAKEFRFFGYGNAEFFPFFPFGPYDIDRAHEAGQAPRTYFVEDTQDKVSFDLYFFLERGVLVH